MVIVGLNDKIPILQFIYFLLFLSFLSSKIVEDDESWGSIEINKSLPHKIDLELEQQFRSDDNFQNIYKMFTDVSLSYPLHLFVDISGKFRFILADDEKEKRYGISIKVNRRKQINFCSKINIFILRHSEFYKASRCQCINLWWWQLYISKLHNAWSSF